MKKPQVYIFALAILTCIILAFIVFEDRPPTSGVSESLLNKVRFSNHTSDAGLLEYSPTWAVVAVDIDGDDRDDLLIGNHGYPPKLYLNRDEKFENASEALPINDRADRHGYIVVDLDNDGDRDLAYAGGGADGIGKGGPNKVYKNLLVETGSLKFVDDSETVDLGDPSMRSRQFLPLANKGGDKVDLYLTSLHKRRKNSSNLYIVNSSDREAIRLNVDKSSSLNQRFESNGSDVFFDYDRDGDADFLRLGRNRAKLYKNHAGTFKYEPSALEKLVGVETAAVADFNNDGYPDLYFGSLSGHTHSDNISNNAEEIHFVIVNQKGDDTDSIAFTMAPKNLDIDFVQHLAKLGKPRIDPSDIYLGSAKSNPKKRKAQISERQAQGKPTSFDKPGTYLWFDTESQLWNMLWKHDPAAKSDAKGIIYSQDIKLVERNNLETIPPKEVSDYVAINQSGLSWRILKLAALKHTLWTNDVTAADFNNDGLIDIAGVRSRDYAAENGTPFLILNHGDLKFTSSNILDNSEDDIFRASLIVHGFFSNDGLPDLFFTNGGGLLPSHKGPYQYWVNESDPDNNYLLLELEGVSSNKDAIGAQVELYDADDNLLGYKELGPAYGRSQDTHKMHFGLGRGTGPFRLSIRWPGQQQPQEITATANTFVKILQGTTSDAHP